MKKFLFVLMTSVMICSAAVAGCYDGKCMGDYKNGKGGFMNSPKKIMSVADVLKQPDDTKVVMEGYIVKDLGHDNYEFSDGTTTVVVEIEDDDWNGHYISPKDKVWIKGEVDHDNGVKVDVKSIKRAR